MTRFLTNVYAFGRHYSSKHEVMKCTYTSLVVYAKKVEKLSTFLGARGKVLEKISYTFLRKNK